MELKKDPPALNILTLELYKSCTNVNLVETHSIETIILANEQEQQPTCLTTQGKHLDLVLTEYRATDLSRPRPQSPWL